MATKLCSLCFSQSCEYTLLQSELGESTKTYEITVTYFDPMLLTGEENSQLVNENKVLCLECWCYIEDFYEFQQTVLTSRSLLEKNRLCTLKVTPKEELTTLCSKDKQTFKDIDGDILLDDLLLIYGNEDEQLLTESITSEAINSTEENDTYIKINLKQEETSQCGKSKRFFKQNTVTESTDSDENEFSNKKTKKCVSPEIPKKIARITYCREICKESDYFISQWKAQLECDLCQESYANFESLRKHFRETHKIKCYIKCCERKFFHRYVLVEHIKNHINPAIHKCDICDKIFANNSNVELHKRVIHEPSKELECNVCHNFFKLKSTLKRHLLTHARADKDFICPECGKGFASELLLKLHIDGHNVDRVCDQCGKTIRGFAAFKKHLVEHDGIGAPKFPCDVCGAQLKTNTNLKNHKAAYHNDGTTLYVCSICGKVAAHKQALLSHKKLVHEDKRKYKCGFCEKAFKRSKVLREHIATHTGQDLYQCAHCPQTFKVSSNLHHHRKKVHPKEWEEARRGRLQIPKVNMKEVTNQVIL